MNDDASATRFCPYCGESAANDYIFCRACGKLLNQPPNTPLTTAFDDGDHRDPVERERGEPRELRAQKVRDLERARAQLQVVEGQLRRRLHSSRDPLSGRNLQEARARQHQMNGRVAELEREIAAIDSAINARVAPLATASDGPRPVLVRSKGGEEGGSAFLVFLVVSGATAVFFAAGYLWPVVVIAVCVLLFLAWRRPTLVARLTDSYALRRIPSVWRATPKRFAVIAAVVSLTLALISSNILAAAKGTERSIATQTASTAQLLATNTALPTTPTLVQPTQTAVPPTVTLAPSTATVLPPTATNVATIVAAAPVVAPTEATPPTTSATDQAAGTAVGAPIGTGPTATPAPSLSPPIVAAQLVGVADGATIRVRLPDGSEPFVLLIGADAPLPNECYGAEAAARTTALLQGRTVELEADANDKDQSGRLLRYVWAWGDDGVRRQVNLELAKGGLAAVYSTPPNTRYQAELASAQQTAQGQKLGLWAACGKAHAALKPTPTVPKVYAIGEVASVTNWALRVAGVERPGDIITWSEFGNATQASGTWFVITLDIKNIGNRNFGVNNFDFYLADARGNRYDPASEYLYSEYQGGSRIGAQVPPGVTVHYYIPFDVNPAATGLHFIFNQDNHPSFAVGDAAP